VGTPQLCLSPVLETAFVFASLLVTCPAVGSEAILVPENRLVSPGTPGGKWHRMKGLALATRERVGTARSVGTSSVAADGDERPTSTAPRKRKRAPESTPGPLASPKDVNVLALL
jgi:hypothetical protein